MTTIRFSQLYVFYGKTRIEGLEVGRPSEKFHDTEITSSWTNRLIEYSIIYLPLYTALACNLSRGKSIKIQHFVSRIKKRQRWGVQTMWAYDLGDHGAFGWCGSSSSIRIPSLKFICLAIRKIWRTMCVSINGPLGRDLWPFDLETGMPVTFKVGNLPSKFGHARPFEFLNYSLCTRRTDRREDGRTNATLIAPFPTGGGIIR